MIENDFFILFRSAFSACKTSEANESDEAKYVENFQKKLTSLYEFWEPIVLYKDSAVQPIKKFVDVAVDSKIIQVCYPIKTEKEIEEFCRK